MKITRRLTRLIVAAQLSLGLVACGNVTVGGFTRVTVDVSGDATHPQPQPTPLGAAAGLASPSPTTPLLSSHEAEGPEGEIEIDLRLALVSESGDVVSLGREDIRIKLDVQGVNRAEAVNELVPAARYTELRISFVHIQVEVEAGLVVDGEEITGEVEVHLEDPELVITRAVDVQAVEGGTVDLLVDLNSPAWLAAVNPATRTVDVSVFAELIDVVMQ